MPNIDLSKYQDLQFFQYTVRQALTASQRFTAGFTKIQNDSDFLLQKIVGTQTGRYNLQLLDTGTGRQLFDRELQDLTVVGTAQRPNVLLHPKLVYANSQLNWTLVDTTAAPNTVEVVLEGIKCYKTLPSGFTPRGVIQLEKYQEVDTFLYSFFTATALGANAATVLGVNIQGDSDFLITKISGRQTGTYRVRLLDSSCGWLYSDQLVDNANLVGTAQQPNVLLHPQLVLANSTILAEVLDTSGAPNTIEVVLEGIKLFLGR